MQVSRLGVCFASLSIQALYQRYPNLTSRADASRRPAEVSKSQVLKYAKDTV